MPLNLDNLSMLQIPLAKQQLHLFSLKINSRAETKFLWMIPHHRCRKLPTHHLQADPARHVCLQCRTKQRTNSSSSVPTVMQLNASKMAMLGKSMFIAIFSHMFVLLRPAVSQPKLMEADMPGSIMNYRFIAGPGPVKSTVQRDLRLRTPW